MKQYTTPEQTAKLIELGFEKPKSVLLYAQSVDCDNNYGWRGEVKYNCDYTIGELIEMFGFHLSSIYYIGIVWVVNAIGLERRSEELIDALYAMIVKLKEEGVI